MRTDHFLAIIIKYSRGDCIWFEPQSFNSFIDISCRLMGQTCWRVTLFWSWSHMATCIAAVAVAPLRCENCMPMPIVVAALVALLSQSPSLSSSPPSLSMSSSSSSSFRVFQWSDSLLLRLQITLWTISFQLWASYYCRGCKSIE